MRISEFTPDIAKRVLELWQQNMGKTEVGTAYLEDPSRLVSEVNSPLYWATGRFEVPLGSRWTKDSKLTISSRFGRGLKIEAITEMMNMYAHKAELNFYYDVKDLLGAKK